MRPHPIAAALLMAVAIQGGDLRATTIDYLHVAANEGSSAGGHAAIRFAGRVYHFQHRSPGLLILDRHDDAVFRWRYGVLQNRTIRAAHLPVSPDTYARLRDRFAERHLAQRRQLAALEALRSERRLLERWLAAEPTADADALPEARPFALERAAPDGRRGTPPALTELRETIERRHGQGAIARRRAAVVAAMRGVVPQPVDAAALRISTWDGPAIGYRFAARWHDLAAALVALDVLARPRPLRPGALGTLSPRLPRLTRGERTRLGRFRARHLAAAARLLASTRPDWGRALLTGMARLAAIDASLASGRLVVVHDDAGVEPPPATAFGRELARDAARTLAAVRTRTLGSGPIGEREYAALEAAAARAIDLEQRPTEPPPGPAALPPLPRPALARGRLTQALAAARVAESRYERLLRDTHGYDLRTHNCVTELFTTIDATFTATESARRLGGHIAPDRRLLWIPTRSFDAVTRSYAPQRVSTALSFRLDRLRTMQAAGSPVLVHVREASTLTSSLYRRNAADPFFVFFTDDATLPRPFYGAVNLLAGLGDTAFGLLRAPIDGGAALVRAGRGLLFTLPELAFVNVRKGRMEYGPIDPPAADVTSSRPF